MIRSIACLGLLAIASNCYEESCLAQDQAAENTATIARVPAEAAVGPNDTATAYVAVKPSKYWIGLTLTELSEEVRAQLDLPSKVGILVRAVAENSPAEKAGIQLYDVLLGVQVSDRASIEAAKNLTSIDQFIEEVRAAEAQPLRLIVLRKGQRTEIVVIPVERPVPTVHNPIVDAGNYNLPITSFRFAGPMITITLSQPPLPEGMTMEFHQVIGQPEKIKVSKGGQTWDVTDAEVATLPEDVRDQVRIQLNARQPGTLPVPQVTVPIPFSEGESIRYRAGSTLLGLRLTEPIIGRLPEDVTLTIVRKGTESAKLTVKRNEQSWDIAEIELHKLPEDLRRVVEPLVISPTRLGMVRSIRTTPLLGTALEMPNPPTPPQGDLLHLYPGLLNQLDVRNELIDQKSKAWSDQLQQQLKDLSEKIDKLQQSIERSSPK